MQDFSKQEIGNKDLNGLQNTGILLQQNMLNAYYNESNRKHLESNQKQFD